MSERGPRHPERRTVLRNPLHPDRDHQVRGFQGMYPPGIHGPDRRQRSTYKHISMSPTRRALSWILGSALGLTIGGVTVNAATSGGVERLFGMETAQIGENVWDHTFPAHIEPFPNFDGTEPIDFPVRSGPADSAPIVKPETFASLTGVINKPLTVELVYGATYSGADRFNDGQLAAATRGTEEWRKAAIEANLDLGKIDFDHYYASDRDGRVRGIWAKVISKGENGQEVVVGYISLNWVHPNEPTRPVHPTT